LFGQRDGDVGHENIKSCADIARLVHTHRAAAGSGTRAAPACKV
jgi:hypothetical protein